MSHDAPFSMDFTYKVNIEGPLAEKTAVHLTIQHLTFEYFVLCTMQSKTKDNEYANEETCDNFTTWESFSQSVSTYLMYTNKRLIMSNY